MNVRTFDFLVADPETGYTVGPSTRRAT